MELSSLLCVHVSYGHLPKRLHKDRNGSHSLTFLGEIQGCTVLLMFSETSSSRLLGEAVLTLVLLLERGILWR